MTIRTRVSAVACVVMLAGTIQGCSGESTAATRQRLADDASLANRVQTALNQDPVLANSRIDIDANSNSHTVILRGHVYSTLATDRATQLASQVDGVDRVVDDMEVTSSGP